MNLVTSDNYSFELSKLFESSSDLDIAVAFLGYDVLELFESSKCRNIRLLCNFESGACNPHLVEKLLQLPNVHLKTNSRLHAKVVLQDSTAIVGSANLSANGLSLEGAELTAWKELGIKFNNQETVNETRNWFVELWEQSANITNNELLKQFENWKKRRKNRPLPKSKLSLIEAALENQEELSDRDIYFAIYREYSSPEADEAFERVTEETEDSSGTSNFFEEWLELPDDAYLVSLRLGPQGGVYFEGLQYMPSKPITKFFTKADGNESNIKICSDVKNILGFRFTNTDKAKVKQHISYITDEEPAGQFAYIVSLSDWADAVNQGT